MMTPMMTPTMMVLTTMETVVIEQFLKLRGEEHASGHRTLPWSMPGRNVITMAIELLNGASKNIYSERERRQRYIYTKINHEKYKH